MLQIQKTLNLSTEVKNEKKLSKKKSQNKMLITYNQIPFSRIKLLKIWKYIL